MQFLSDCLATIVRQFLSMCVRTTEVPLASSGTMSGKLVYPSLSLFTPISSGNLRLETFYLSYFLHSLSFFQHHGEATAGSHVDGDLFVMSAMDGFDTIGVGVGLPIGSLSVSPKGDGVVSLG